MNRRLQLILSSIGKKELVALTGLGFVVFLIAHLAGNMTIASGAEALDGYAAKLEALGPLVRVAEAGLLLMLVLHVVFSMAAALRNYQARGQRYALKRWEGAKTLGSWTMWITGPWILVFLGLHIWQFTVQHQVLDGGELSKLVSERLSAPPWAAYYGVSMVVVGLHVSHGLWSALQTLGIGPGRKGHLRDVSVLLGMVFAAGFGLLAFYVFYIPDLLK